MKIDSIIIAASTIILIAATHIYTFLYTPPSMEKAVKTVFVPQGASFNIIARELEKEGIITNAGKFSLLAKFKSAITKIKAGEYEFSTSMTPLEVLDMMLKGEVKDYAITIPEGYNIREIALVLNNINLLDKDEFAAKAMNATFVASLGIDGDSVEGYLFPDTYRLTKGISAEEIINKMVQRFNAVYNEIAYKKPYGFKMSKKQIVTLASIIEKETGDGVERPLISAVFHNRIKKGMRLESDPTVIYGINRFNGNLTRKDLLTKTPYNTYQIYGLPPGPIANPGRASLEAAVSPSDEKYLFFVSKNNGSHYFSKSLKEHNSAVQFYQKAWRKNKKQNMESRIKTIKLPNSLLTPKM
ncbi:MAG: endolytic transglycosylase MltG [Deltaproteobacteria bacterium]|nr:endolytic transglycosylase MltG [Deltaproteobacteria bacterium]